MTTFKEIVTKAVIGKGKKQIKSKENIIPEEIPNTVLGCWIINHEFKGNEQDGKIIIEGSYDVNVWYSYDNDTKTKVVTKKYNYKDISKLNAERKSELNDKPEIIVRALKQPICTDVKINEDKINFVIEKDLGIEIVGDIKVKIAVEEKEEEWEIIKDEEEKERKVEKEIDENVEEKFI